MRSPASIWRRLVAYALDVVLLAVAMLAVQALLLPVNPLRGGEPPTGWSVHAWVLSTVSVPIAAYFAASFASGRGATVGMRLLRLAVRTTSGERVPLPQAVLRAVVLLIPFELNHVVLLHPRPVWAESPPAFRWGFAVIDALVLVYVAIAVATPRRQGPHDLAAGTVVEADDHREMMHRP